METITKPVPGWGLAAMPLAGESESGDCCVVKAFDKGVLVAVVDALGHGREAATPRASLQPPWRSTPMKNRRH